MLRQYLHCLEFEIVNTKNYTLFELHISNYFGAFLTECPGQKLRIETGLSS